MIFQGRHQDLSRLYWVTAVKGHPGDYRIHVKSLLIEDGLAVKTDGSRIHCAKLLLNIENGIYHICKRTKSKINIIRDPELKRDNWPGYEHVFPGHVDFKMHDLPPKSSSVGINLIYIKLIRDILRNVNVQYRFIEDLYCTGDIFSVVEYKKSLDLEPIIFFNGSDKGAAIMPLRG